jgi:hypothetical protein
MQHIKLFEQFYGNIITAYHRTKTIDSVKSIIENGFRPAHKTDWGKGIYFFIEEKHLNNPLHKKEYGGYVLKCKIDISQFLILDEAISKKYGFGTVEQQLCAKLFNKKYKHKAYDVDDDHMVTIQGKVYKHHYFDEDGNAVNHFKSEDGKTINSDKVQSFTNDIPDEDIYDFIADRWGRDPKYAIDKESLWDLRGLLNKYGGVEKYFKGIVVSDDHYRFNFDDDVFGMKMLQNPLGFIAIPFGNSTIKIINHYTD